MKIKSTSLSRKYAEAFLNVNQKKLSENSLWNLKKAFEFLDNNLEILAVFDLPAFARINKLEAIQLFFKKFNLENEFNALFELLLKHNRTALLSDVLKSIYSLYPKYLNALLFDFKSASELNKEEQIILQKFLAKQTQKNIIYYNTIDNNLIAGIRLQSENLIWDRSIKGRLDHLKTLAARG